MEVSKSSGSIIEPFNMFGQSSKLSAPIECPRFSELCKLGPTITHAIVLNLKLRYTIEYIYIFKI